MQGVPVADPEGAFLWFQHAYDKRGSQSAAYHLGRCHFLGVGTVDLANACSSPPSVPPFPSAAYLHEANRS